MGKEEFSLILADAVKENTPDGSFGSPLPGRGQA